MFTHRNIHKQSCISPHRKAHNQIYHILIDKRQHSNIVDIQSLKEADYYTDHYLVGVKVIVRERERETVSK